MPKPARSTAKFIAYDLRPAKQSERSLLIDILKLASTCGVSIRDYKYIGMGANRFYDFLMLHKHLGIKSMVSLEHDPKMYERAKFNVPYRFIDVRNQTVQAFLESVKPARKEILWLDYDGGIGPDIVADIATLASRAKAGHFCFVTVAGHPPRVIENSSSAERLAHFRESMPEVAVAIKETDLERATFPLAVYKLLTAAFKSAFAVHSAGEFVFLLQVAYADTMPMITVGGALLSKTKAARVRKKVGAALPFLADGSLYDIRSFHLTEKERSLFDRAVTSSSVGASPEHETLATLGFKDTDITAYSELVRYVPRYVEAAI